LRGRGAFARTTLFAGAGRFREDDIVCGGGALSRGRHGQKGAMMMVTIQTLIDVMAIVVALVGSYYISQNRISKLEENKADKSVVNEIRERLVGIELKLDMILRGKVRIPNCEDE
jgi:hypothetical protein